MKICKVCPSRCPSCRRPVHRPKRAIRNALRAAARSPSKITAISAIDPILADRKTCRDSQTSARIISSRHSGSTRRGRGMPTMQPWPKSSSRSMTMSWKYSLTFSRTHEEPNISGLCAQKSHSRLPVNCGGSGLIATVRILFAKRGPKMAIVGYARVSTRDQNSTGQIYALKAAGAGTIFGEKVSGARA